MAQVPRYGRRVGPPGPDLRSRGGSAYQSGLSAWGEIVGDWGRELAEKDEEIKKARESTQVVRGLAQYTLDLDSLLTDVTRLEVDPQSGRALALDAPPDAPRRPANPEEQAAYFQGKAAEIEQRITSIKGLRPEAQTELRNNMTEMVTSAIVKLRRAQRQRAFENVRDGLEFSWQAMVRSGDEAGARAVLGIAVREDVIASSVAEQRIKEFPIDAELYGVRRQIDMLTQSDVPMEVKIEGTERLVRRLEGVLQGDPSEGQRSDAQTMLRNLRQDAAAFGVARDKQDKDRMEAVGRSVYGDIVTHDATGGKEGRLYTPSQLHDLYVAGSLGKEQYDGMVKIVTGQGAPDPWSALQAEVLITDVDSGYRTLENAMARQLELAPNLTADQRATFNADLAKARSAWRGQLRRKGESAIETAINPPGTIIPIPATVAAVAKMQFWAAVREAEDKQEVLAEERFVPLAVDIATRTVKEYKLDRGGFNAKHGFTSTQPTPAGTNVPAEPNTLDEFVRTVQSLTDEEQSRAYYDRWRVKFE